MDRANSYELIPPPAVACQMIPQRLLLGPGPSNSSQRILSAMAQPPLGYMDPNFLETMKIIQSMLRYCFQTNNDVTLAISGTGSAAMEAAIANVVETGDVVLVGISGYFGERLAEIALRYGADIRTERLEWGLIFELADIKKLLECHRPAVLCLVMVETSTGALQPLEGVGDLCREFGCLLLVDAVTGLCTSPLLVDSWGIDICYSCSQKGLSCCPGASPLTLSQRAMNKVKSRKSLVSNWYLDLNLLMKYWAGQPRVYHHTAPINLFYALREALSLIAEEGINSVWVRHQRCAEYLYEQLHQRGLQFHVADPRHRAPAMTTVVVPSNVDAAAVIAKLRDEGVEIGAGMGQLAGKIWRVGLLGFNAKKENIDKLISLLDIHLK